MTAVPRVYPTPPKKSFAFSRQGHQCSESHVTVEISRGEEKDGSLGLGPAMSR